MSGPVLPENIGSDQRPPVPHAEILEFVKPTLAKEGVDLDIKVFTDFIHTNLI